MHQLRIAVIKFKKRGEGGPYAEKICASKYCSWKRKNWKHKEGRFDRKTVMNCNCRGESKGRLWLTTAPLLFLLSFLLLLCDEREAEYPAVATEQPETEEKLIQNSTHNPQEGERESVCAWVWVVVIPPYLSLSLSLSARPISNEILREWLI